MELIYNGVKLGDVKSFRIEQVQQYYPSGSPKPWLLTQIIVESYPESESEGGDVG